MSGINHSATICQASHGVHDRDGFRESILVPEVHGEERANSESHCRACLSHCVSLTILCRGFRPVQLVATAACFLAAKVEECPRSLLDVAYVHQRAKLDRKPEELAQLTGSSTQARVSAPLLPG